MYIRKDTKSGMLSIENVDFIRTFLLYTQKRNIGQNLVPKMGIYLNISAELIEINVICVDKKDCNRLW